MKLQTLPVKRRPVSNGIFKRLRAVTGNRKQRVAAAAPTHEIEADESSSKISRALTIIFLIHIVAIGLIFVHQKFLDGRTPDELKPATAEKQDAVPAAGSIEPRVNLPRLAAGEVGQLVVRGDNYARVAARLGVDEGDLRLINQHVDIIPGLVLKVPPKRPTAEAPVVATSLGEIPAEDSGLVDAVDPRDAPRAKLVRPNIASTAATPVTTSGKSYVVKSGDSIWRIANKFKVNQDALMKANGINDAGKLKVGASLAIPN